MLKEVIQLCLVNEVAITSEIRVSDESEVHWSESGVRRFKSGVRHFEAE
jgi:hypothetical protein